MTVYECIKELSRYPADKKVIFFMDGEFFTTVDRAFYQGEIEIESIEINKNSIIVNFTN